LSHNYLLTPTFEKPWPELSPELGTARQSRERQNGRKSLQQKYQREEKLYEHPFEKFSTTGDDRNMASG
jgi:hypothetical protein